MVRVVDASRVTHFEKAREVNNGLVSCVESFLGMENVLLDLEYGLDLSRKWWCLCLHPCQRIVEDVEGIDRDCGLRKSDLMWTSSWISHGGWSRCRVVKDTEQYKVKDKDCFVEDAVMGKA